MVKNYQEKQMINSNKTITLDNEILNDFIDVVQTLILEVNTDDLENSECVGTARYIIKLIRREQTREQEKSVNTTEIKLPTIQNFPEKSIEIIDWIENHKKLGGSR